jgi:ABC-type multidrug transport system fused ATPase/permease subunit
MHAAGHAALAVAAGGCAQALGGGAGLLVSSGHAASLTPLFRGGPISFALAGLGAVTVKATGGAWAAHAQAAIGGEVGASLRLRALDGWLAAHRLRRPRHSDHASLAGTSPSAALAALTYQVREVEAGLTAGVLGSARALLQLAPLGFLLGWMSPRLALAAALSFAGFSLLLGRARRAWKRANARAAAHHEALLAAADEAVRHAELWTTYGAERRVRAHLSGIGAAIVRQSARMDASASGLSGANEVLGAAALLFAILAARAGWLGASSGEGALLPFAVTFFLAYRPIRDLTDARLTLARAEVAFDALTPLLDAAEEAERGRADEASEEPAPCLWPLASLEVEGLELARGVAPGPLSFRVPAGGVLALVGATGSGKTTLLRTLLGLEAARGGVVRYGGRHIESSPSGPASRPFAWVPQEAPLLADTIEANVALAPGSDDARASLAAVGARGLLLDAGEERVGPAGRALSGGEREWVNLARAVASRLPVLLLDEPTSGLDPASRRRVLDAIARLRGSRSVILVTHREDELPLADVVLRIDSAAAAAERAA